MNYISFFDNIRLSDVAKFGGKNASLGEMIYGLTAQGVRVPEGFATTADAYRYYLEKNNLQPAMKKIIAELSDVQDTEQVKFVSIQLKKLILEAEFPSDFEQEIVAAYEKLSRMYDPQEWCDVAVRSSATAEDLPGASFAGQQETYLHIMGPEMLLQACKQCMASLFTERALVYRHQQKIDELNVALSVGVQKMIRSDKASSGVMFTLDTETGFKNVVSISSSYGLGEMVVQGGVNPDEFVVHKEKFLQGFRPLIKKVLGSKEEKFVYSTSEVSSSWLKKYTPAERHGSLIGIAADLMQPPLEIIKEAISQKERDTFSLTDDQVFELAEYAIAIEDYYSRLHGHWCPMDIEWAQDGIDKKLYIVQARPETVHSKKKFGSTLIEYSFLQKPSKSEILTIGQSVGDSIASGAVRVMRDIHEQASFKQGEVLVADMTDPDWVPLMKKAAAIITNRGGRTCHAAIVSRELGIPAVIGTENATEIFHDGQDVTIDCSSGSEGFVYAGKLKFERIETDLGTLPKPPVDLLVNIGNPDSAFRISALPVDGVGLARLEFIISSLLKVHPMAVACPEKVTDEQVLKKIAALAVGYPTARDYFVNKLAQSIGMIAGAFYPRPVIVRLTDFKTNEYRDLLGGSYFEPEEENPMLGFRGAVRYRSERYAHAFELECEALKKAREEMGFDNIRIMVPFVRTVPEAQAVVEVLSQHGLERGKKGLELFMMVEIPSNVLLLKDFAHFFDGFSIGSNDLTQLTLGVDRDSGVLAHLFDERDPAVKEMVSLAIGKARENKIYIGICGQAPSDYPEFADFLINAGINSLSLIPDSVIPFLKRT